MEFGGQREDVPGARSPERVTDGHSAAIRIQTVVWDLEAIELKRQFAKYSERLGSERLVDLPDIDGCGREASTLQGSGDGERGGDPHVLGVEGVRGRCHHPGQWSDAQRLGRGATGDYDGAGPVRESRGVARGHLGGVGLWRESSQLFGRGIASDALVVLKRAARLRLG